MGERGAAAPLRQGWDAGSVWDRRSHPRVSQERRNLQGFMLFPLAESIDLVCAWLQHTSLSHAIRVTGWIIPTAQIIHILAIAAVAGSALMIDLRLIGLLALDQSPRDVSARFLPFVWWPLLVLLATGAIMIIGEPPRELKNPAFQLKMLLLAAALIVTWLIGLLLRRLPAGADPSAGHRLAAAAIAVLSMLLWSSIVFAGRWIAYYA
jgi:hypothetical protein